MPSPRTVIVVCRHGERLDYVERDAGRNWVAQSCRPWDPPLTEFGKAQGRAMGEALQRHVAAQQLPPIQNIYSSPFLRCRQTAVEAAKGIAGVAGKGGESEGSVKDVKVEMGLGESLSESWFRSWALPYSDGTWGCAEKDENGKKVPVDETALHPKAKAPVMELLQDWKAGNPCGGVDETYESSSSHAKDYSWGNFESLQEQRDRMERLVKNLSSSSGTTEGGSTNVFVSHGGPTTHLYEALTGNHWSVHGIATYACFSVYERTEEDGFWKALVVNESRHAKNQD